VHASPLYDLAAGECSAAPNSVFLLWPGAIKRVCLIKILHRNVPKQLEGQLELLELIEKVTRSTTSTISWNLKRIFCDKISYG